MEKLQKLSLRFLFGLLLVSGSSYCQNKDKQYFMDRAWSFPQTSPTFRFWLESGIKVYPQDAELWREVSTSYFKAGMYAPAMKYINKAVELDPESWLSYRAFMKCIFLKDYENAIIDFKQAIKPKGKMYEMDHTFYFYIGISYLKINQLDSANHYMKLSVDMQLPRGIKGVHFVDWHYWGIIKYQQKNYTKALEYFNNAIDQYSGFPDALYYKSLILLKQKKKKEAVALLKLAETKLLQGYRLNEANEPYVNYPFQITIEEVRELLQKNV